MVKRNSHPINYFRKKSVLRSLIISIILTIGLLSGVILVQRSQSIPSFAQSIECSDWCAGDDQCYQANGRRPSSGQMCNYAGCSAGLAPCCANGVCDHKEVGGGDSGGGTQMCDTSSVTAKYCRGKAVGYNVGPCTCRRTTGTLCGCFKGPAPTKTPTPTTPPASQSCKLTINGKKYTTEAGRCGCNVPGYDLKICAGNNTWYKLNNVCNSQCHPTTPPPANTSCDKLGNSPDNAPEPDCIGKRVGQSCGTWGGKCTVINQGRVNQYCDCATTSN